MKPLDDRSPLCSYLEWDSAFFGRRIARLNRHRLDEAAWETVLHWCNANRVDCLYFLADADDVQTHRLAEQNRFELTDVRVTFEQALSAGQPVSAPEGVRPACEADLDVLRSIARDGHRDTRFYFDQHFERAQCDRFYETWIENSFRGFSKVVLVAEEHGIPVGYVTCDVPKPQETQIGIIGVAHQQQGSGIGTKLVNYFLAWSIQQGSSRARVVTQGRNVRAQRLYQRSGFVTASLQLWYHRWFAH